MSVTEFANSEVLRFAKLALPQTEKPRFVCEVVDTNAAVVKDTRIKKPKVVLTIQDNGKGRYVVDRVVYEGRYDDLYRVVAGNVAYIQQPK